ncbi:MAG: ATP-grasp domain-containing protein [Candidatus Cloacimonetes bacterium]|nr:ATP-grasp domain-containing protein [Candidatus Cloacimonadota bacterium]
MNILLPSTGRRVTLIKLLRQAAKKLDIPLKLVGTEIYEHTPSLRFCDYFEMVPRMDHANFNEALKDVLDKYQIDFILPGSDLDLKYFLSNPIDSKVRVLDSGSTLKKFLSKTESAEFFKKHGLNVPEIYQKNGSKSYPSVLKEDLGYGSVNQFKIYSDAELDVFWPRLTNGFIQKWVDGKEYTVDVFSDNDCNIINILPRVRDKVRAGVSDVGYVCMNQKLIELIQSINQNFALKGPWNIQCIEHNNEFYFLEINPRFSGGIPLTIAAGLDFCQNLLEWACDRKISSFEVEHEHLIMMKYESELYV